MGMRAILYRRWLRAFAYLRPGYSLTFDDDKGFVITCETFDADSVPELLEQSHGFGYPDEGMNRAEFYDWVVQCLFLQAFHEICEFVRIAGAQRYNPHRESIERITEIFGNIKLAEFTPR